ncbi:MAG: hypothetical protein Q7V56_08145 [Gammaproteobacteria bacterium]|nr:hypothetical protein [Gammaproteobacteria bacterium]
MRVTPFRLTLCRLSVAMLLMLAVNSNAVASTLLQMNFGDVAEGAELIFEGRVLAVEPRQQPGEMIKTWVTFAVIDVVKGDFAEDEIELSFLGGRLGDRQLEVTDMAIPEVGETGFYFVEALLEAQVNPLLGWDQGRYLIETQPDGDTVVTTADHDPVLALEVDTPAAANGQPMNILETGRADGVVVQSFSTPSFLSQPMSAEDFKTSILSVLARP